MGAKELLFICLLLCADYVSSEISKSQSDTNTWEQAAEQKVVKLHEVNAVNLVLFTSLLILIVLTIWFFKHHQFPFLHETGLTLIYGLILGIVVKYGISGSPEISSLVVVPNRSSNRTLDMSDPPDYLKLKVGEDNESVYFHYKMTERMYGNLGASKDQLSEEQATFSPEIFMNILLPPIIFNAGYSLKRKHFFRNIGAIMLFAFIGTTISCIVVGYTLYGIVVAAGLNLAHQECLLFGALISATDPVTILAVLTDMRVDADLFALVFGESALNDAVAIVLFQTIDAYIPTANTTSLFDAGAFFQAVGKFFAIFLGSFGLGAVTGCSNALVTKYTNLSDFPLLETSLFLLMSYLSFLVAEAAGMTGIVSVLFCGICQAHYTYNNLSEESRGRTKQFFEVLTFLSENFIFTYIGTSMFTSESLRFDGYFIAGAFFAIAVGRALNIYPLSFVANIRRSPKIPIKHQHMLVFSGLRGAIAFALAIRNTSTPARQIIYATTSLIVIFTVLFNGGLAMQMINLLKIKHGAETEQEVTPQFQPVSTSEPDESIEGEPGEEIPSEGGGEGRKRWNPWDKAFLPRKWYNFDSAFMKPLFTNARPNLMETMPKVLMPIARILTTTKQMTNTNSEQSLRPRSASDSTCVGDQSYRATCNGPPANMSRSSTVSGDLAVMLDAWENNFNTCTANLEVRLKGTDTSYNQL